MHKWVCHFFAALWKRKKFKKFLIAFLKKLTYSKDCSESSIRTSVPAFLCCHWSISPVYNDIAGFQNNFQYHSRSLRATFRVTGFLKARTSFFKRAIGRIFIINKWFSKASRSLFLIFSTKRPPYIVLFGNLNAVFRSLIWQVEFRKYMFRIFVTAPKKQQPYLLK